MKTIFTLVCFLFFAGAAHAETLCAKDEQVLFSCAVAPKKKIASICASKNLSKTEGYLQYRFGKKEKVELEFPVSREKSQTAFYYGHYFRAQVDRTRVGFTNSGVNYELFNDYEGEENPPVSETGIRIGENDTRLCAGKVVDEMSKLETVLPCENDDAWDCVAAK